MSAWKYCATARPASIWSDAINYGNGRRYPRYAPAGHNGALIFARLSLSL